MAEKLKSWDELKNLRSSIQKEAEASKDQVVIAVGTATCGVAAGANNIMAAIEDEMKKSKVSGAKVAPTGCFGFCYAEPMVEVRTANGSFKYGPVDEALAREIVQKHVKKGEVIDQHVIKQEVERA